MICLRCVSLSIQSGRNSLFPVSKLSLFSRCNASSGNISSGKAAQQKQGFGKWLMLVFPVGGLILGTWQVRRKQWKLGLIRQLEERTKSNPIPLPDDVSELENLEYRPVTVHGAFDHSRELYIEPRSLVTGNDDRNVDAGSLLSTKKSNVGAQVVTPFFIPDKNMTILVNRGFVAKDKKNPNSRLQGQVDGLVEVTGLLRHNEKRPPLIPKNKPSSNQWYYKDLNEMAGLTGTSPILVDAINTTPGGPIGGQTRVKLRDEHVSYAITWYSLALATGAMWYIRFIK